MAREWIELNAEILSAASVVGKKEREGPLGERFDLCDMTDRFGVKTWEAAESEMQRMALNTALAKAKCRDCDLGALFAGDLLNQCVGSAYGLLAFDVPYFGLYGACSTSAEGLLLASAMVTHGVFSRAAAVTSSHYCSAERQYRTPLEYGGQRAPTAQWTVTGAGAFVVGQAGASAEHARVVIRRGMPGRAIERGINDANNMGAAMAPAAEDTLARYFQATDTRPADYDLIATGDLGFEGGSILCELMQLRGYPLGDRYTDCGQRIYFREGQDVHGGGSGCGCSAVVLAAELIPRMRRGDWKRILFAATGAMMSPDSIKQGQNIPAIAHLIELVAE
ncbi:MAG: stage V sporulation protein AD [Ruminococcaceae bacterium]|nr:stage V sporulation protein AD [Oscillospiraceae bacterium]